MALHVKHHAEGALVDASSRARPASGFDEGGGSEEESQPSNNAAATMECASVSLVTA